MARKTTRGNTRNDSRKVPGEGDHRAGPRLRQGERGFAAKDVRRSAGEERASRAAGPAEAPERRRPDDSDTNDPHVEENLDRGLEETFPASDAVSISIDPR
ncbi:MAG TPA: hypothetical protein VME40_00665 [Caulobacteraceae bacterium]|nr:hypothetical protein [Caulobacteraceae bacterium]